MIHSPPAELPTELQEKVISNLQARNNNKVRYLQIVEAAPAYRQSHLSVCGRNIHLSGRTIRDPMNENKGVFRWDKLREELEKM